MEARLYQTQAVKKCLELFFTKQHLLFVFPCASGKTFMMKMIIDAVLKVKPDFKCCIIIDDVRLVKQTAEIMPYAKVYCASLGLKEIGNITITTIQSMRKANFPLFDLYQRDEVHAISRHEVKFFSDKKVIGWTATPWKSNKPIYGDDKLFKCIDFEKTIKEMTDAGYIVPLVHQDIDEKTDLSHVKITAGEYNQKELALSFSPEKITTIINEALNKSKNRRAVIWSAVNIELATFMQSVIPDSVLLHSKLSFDKQTEAIDNFKSGKVRHIVSVLQLTKGFNATNADCLVLVRPTRSIALYRQMAGRVLRLHPGKTNGLLLDFGGVVESLGTIYDDYDGAKEVSKKLCPHCMQFISRDTPACVPCNFIFPVVPREIERGEVDYYKNLTAKAYSKLKKITRISVNKHKAKSGKYCLKVIYWENNRPHVTEYLQPYKYKKFIKWNYLTDRIPNTMEEVIEIANNSLIAVVAIETKGSPYAEITKRIIRER